MSAGYYGTQAAVVQHMMARNKIQQAGCSCMSLAPQLFLPLNMQHLSESHGTTPQIWLEILRRVLFIASLVVLVYVTLITPCMLCLLHTLRRAVVYRVMMAVCHMCHF